MGALALLALFGAAGALMIFGDDDPDEGTELDITESGEFSGTEGNDTVTIGGTVSDVSLDTGAGDDSVVGFGVFEADADNATISTGAGDDLIDLNLESSTVQGGDGNDTITVAGVGVDVYGGAGDDLIDVPNGGGPGMNAYGGEGNDTLQSGTPATAPFDSNDGGNATLNGGDGDDLIYVNGPASAGTGFVVVGHGDAGNDTIIMSSVHPSLSIVDYTSNVPIQASGGEGQDAFIIRTHDATLESLDEVEEFGFVDYISRDGVFTFEMFEIEDFEPGVDTLSIDADAITDGGTLAAARLEETVNGYSDPITELILTYESTAQQPVQVIVTLSGTTGVTWDDVEFLGEQTPTLTPITQPV